MVCATGAPAGPIAGHRSRSASASNALDFAVPAAEIDALIALLAGLVRHARDEGFLAPAGRQP